MGIYWLTRASHKIRFRSSVQLSGKVLPLSASLPSFTSLSLFLAHLLLLSLLMAWQFLDTFISGLSPLPWHSACFFFPPSFTLKKPQKALWQGWFESHAHPDCGPCEHGVCGVLGWGRPDNVSHLGRDGRQCGIVTITESEWGEGFLKEAVAGGKEQRGLKEKKKILGGWTTDVYWRDFGSKYKPSLHL